MVSFVCTWSASGVGSLSISYHQPFLQSGDLRLHLTVKYAFLLVQEGVHATGSTLLAFRFDPQVDHLIIICLPRLFYPLDNVLWIHVDQIGGLA